MSKRKNPAHPRSPVKTTARARPRKPANAKARKAKPAEASEGALAEALASYERSLDTPDLPDAFDQATVFPHTFVSVTLHACGKAAGIAVCGSRQEGIPAGDPKAWGSLLERAEPMRAALAELEQLAVTLECPNWCRVEICGGCRANLTKMIDADERRLQVGRGKHVQQGAVAQTGAG